MAIRDGSSDEPETFGREGDKINPNVSAYSKSCDSELPESIPHFLSPNL